jgi:hypothetical protein
MVRKQPTSTVQQLLKTSEVRYFRGNLLMSGGVGGAYLSVSFSGTFPIPSPLSLLANCCCRGRAGRFTKTNAALPDLASPLSL